MHKWWHFFFVSMDYRHIRETSYDGSMLYREYSCITKRCSKCKAMRLEIEDFKDSKEVVLDFDRFDVINKKRIELGYTSY